MAFLSKPLKPVLRHLWHPSIRVAALAWSFSAWAKVSLLDRRQQIWIPVRFSDQERRYLSSYYLLVAVVILRVIRPNLPRFPIFFKRQHIWRTSLLLALVIVVDEWIHWTINRRFERERRRWVCVGRPAPIERTDDDCMICQGVATATNTENRNALPPSRHRNHNQQQYYEQQQYRQHSRSFGINIEAEEEEEGENISDKHYLHELYELNDVYATEMSDHDDLLESFCIIPDHVAHRACMRAWWMSQSEQQATAPPSPPLSPLPQFNLTEVTPMDTPNRAATTTATAERNLRNRELSPTNSIRCPCCRRHLKLTVRLSCNSKSSVNLFLLFLKHQRNGSSRELAMRRQMLFYQLAHLRSLITAFARHLCQRTTTQRSLITVGFGVATFLMAATTYK
ncbi:hypothetical protein BDF19DRAFT_436017 [Syncephalis fuscata]|nr:hypothetical protein BDF19DRAFT_436017 [Syncephalis fuscata]